MENNSKFLEQLWNKEVSKQVIISKIIRVLIAGYILYYIIERIIFSYNLGVLEFGIIIFFCLLILFYIKYSKANLILEECEDITMSLPNNLEILLIEVSERLNIKKDKLKIYVNPQNYGLSPNVQNKNKFNIIVIPLGYFKLIDENREYAKIILAHELSHIKQQDSNLLNFTKVFLKILAFLIPFNIIYGVFFISVWHPYLVKKDQERIFNTALLIMLNKVNAWNSPSIKDVKLDTSFFLRTDTSVVYLDFNPNNPPDFGRSRFVLTGDSIFLFAEYMAKKISPYLKNPKYVKTLPIEDKSNTNIDNVNDIKDENYNEPIIDENWRNTPKYLDMEQYIPNRDTTNKIERVLKMELGKIRPLPKIKAFDINDIFISVLILFFIFITFKRAIYNSERVADFGAVISSSKEDVAELLNSNNQKEIKPLDIFNVNPPLTWRIKKILEL